jgi:hypothetical protein
MRKSVAPRRHLPSSPFKAPVTPSVEQFLPGDRISHDQYGLGKVIGVEDGIAVLVDFGTAQKRILSPYAQITVL